MPAWVFECKPQGPPEEVGLPDVACARVPPRRATHRSGRKAGHPADRAVRPGLVTATRACCPARPRSLGSLTACGEMVVSVWVISTGSSGAVLFVSGSMILSVSIRERGRSSGVSAMTEAVLSGGDTSSRAGISRAGSPALPQTPVAAAFRVVQVIAGRVPRVSRVVGTAYCGRTERPDLDRQRDQTAFCRRRTGGYLEPSLLTPHLTGTSAAARASVSAFSAATSLRRSSASCPDRLAAFPRPVCQPTIIAGPGSHMPTPTPGSVFRRGELHARGRRICPGECGRE